MTFSTWSIRNPAPIVLLFSLLVLLGILGFRQLGIQQFPDMDLPIIQITASLEGAAPEQLEVEVARKIEDKLTALTLLDHVATTISDGTVSINASFVIDKDSEIALTEVRSAVDSVAGRLPSGMNSPMVSKVTAEATSLLTYSVAASAMDDMDLSWFIDNDLNKALLSVPGVATVSRLGGIDREIHVDLDPTVMAGLGLTASMINTQLKAVAADSSGGQAHIGDQYQALRTLAASDSLQTLRALYLPLSNGQYIPLTQTAKITDAHAERSSIALLDGKPIMAIQIARAKGFSDVGVANQVRTAMKQFVHEHPDIQLTEIANITAPVLDNYHGSMHLLIEGAGLAVIVVFGFLRNWRSTLIAAIALPLSILPTFAIMAWAGFSLNLISLLALALVVGVLVDDAIVEIENIERHRQSGKSAQASAIDAVNEIGLAVVATTLTLVAVFLPTAFMGGIPGKIFRQFGITAAVAVLTSLLVARLLTPMLAAYFLKPQCVKHTDSRLMTHYLAWVQALLQRPRRTVLIAGGFFTLSLCFTPFIGRGFFPAQDDGQSQVALTLAPGSTLAETTARTQQALTLLKSIPEIRQVFAAIGTSNSSDTASSSQNTATLTIDLVARSQRTRSQTVIEQAIRQALQPLAGARIAVGRGTNGEQLTLTLASDDPVALTQAVGTIEQAVRHIAGIGTVTSSATGQRPEIHITPDNAKAAMMGVSATALAELVRVATYGDYTTNLTKLNLPQRQVNIRVRLAPLMADHLAQLQQLRLVGTKGMVALGSIATLALSSGPAQIDRLDRSRQVTLAIELNGRAIGAVMQEITALPAMRALPSSVHLIEQGELQQMNALFASFGFAMAVGIFCIYAVLVLLFHDFLQPLTILAALPLSIVGALMALLLTGQAFSMPSIIGILMLMGIVTKNSILLVEYAIMARRMHGLSTQAALIDACHKRVRPILMTTLAMSAGMLPLALGLGADPSFRQPLAIVVLGGLFTSTLLSLLVIPALFLLMDRAKQRFLQCFITQHESEKSPQDE